MGEKTKQCAWCDAPFVPEKRNQRCCCPGHANKLNLSEHPKKGRPKGERKKKFGATDAARFAELRKDGKHGKALSYNAIGRMFNSMGDTVKLTLRREGYEV